tara:strand:+ start:563 stop:955 length:393 start_codon:yes stop_codon:yes gene_type:complete
VINRAIVDNETGIIIGTGICQECDFNLVPEGTTAYVNTGDWRDDTHKLVNGEFVEIVPTADEILQEGWFSVRTIRDGRLKQSDWTQVPDSPLSAEQRSEWQMYRQKLRDLPADYAHVTAIEDVVWPTAPS